MENQDKIKELFSDKLGNYSAPVNPELWNAIAAKVAVTSSVAATGTSLLVKGIIGLGAASIIGVASYILLKSEPVQSTALVENAPINKIAIDSESNTTDVQLKEVKTSSTHTEKANSEDKYITLSSNQTANSETIIDNSQNTDRPVYVPKVRETNPNINPPINPNIGKENGEGKSIQEEPENKDPVTDNGGKTPVKLASTAEITRLPNVFSPNGDGVNDEVFIQYKGELLDFNIVILDKSNHTIFESKDPNFNWNGFNRQGEMIENGTYYFIITARDSNGNAINKYNLISVER